MPKYPSRNGFTLIEVLVVVAIIALLAAILIPSLKEARDAAQRTGCAANLHGFGKAMTYYSTDFPNYYFYNLPYDFATGNWPGITAGGVIGADSVVSLALDMKSIGKPGSPGYNANTVAGSPNKKYIRDWDSLICPGTRNKIRFAKDLNNNADNRYSGPSDGQFGHSYEWWNGFQKNDYAQRGPIGASKRAYSGSESDTNGDGFPDCLKRPKIVEKRASYVILVLDGEDPEAYGGYRDNNNFPDSPADNHGPKGWNMIFADMHARWVRNTQTYTALDRSDMDTSAVPPEYIPRDKGPPPPPPG